MALGKEKWAELLDDVWKDSHNLPEKSIARIYIKFFKEWQGNTKFFNKSGSSLDDDLSTIRNWMTHTTYGRDILSHLSIQQQEMIAQRSPKIFRDIFSQSIRVGNPQNVSKRAIRHAIQNLPTRLKQGMAYWYRIYRDRNNITEV